MWTLASNPPPWAHESTGESFHFMGRGWDVSRAWDLVKKQNATDTVRVADLVPFFRMIRIDPRYMQKERLDLPLLVAPVDGGGVVIDGYHRAYLAHQLGIEELPAIVLTKSQEKKVRINPHERPLEEAPLVEVTACAMVDGRRIRLVGMEIVPGREYWAFAYEMPWNIPAGSSGPQPTMEAALGMAERAAGKRNPYGGKWIPYTEAEYLDAVWPPEYPPGAPLATSMEELWKVIGGEKGKKAADDWYRPGDRFTLVSHDGGHLGTLELTGVEKRHPDPRWTIYRVWVQWPPEPKKKGILDGDSIANVQMRAMLFGY